MNRVSFLVDLFKVCRWLAAVNGPNSDFHLVPNVRVKTRNDHHITWTKAGILKEFDHTRDMTEAVKRIGQVYEKKLRHVEHGMVRNDRSIIITRVGVLLTLANMENLGLTREVGEPYCSRSEGTT